MQTIILITVGFTLFIIIKDIKIEQKISKIIMFLMPNDLSKEVIRSLLPLVIFIAFGYLIFVFYTFQFLKPNFPFVAKEFFSILGMGTLTAGAFLTSGGILGFLFGIPKIDERSNRVNESEQTNKQNSTIQEYNPNTNLEQISDWFTKILVGIGLTQIPLIQEELLSLTNYLKPSFGIAESDNGGIVLMIIIYFSISGFLAGFLWSRLDLPGKFRGVDQNLVQEISKNVKRIEELARQYENDTDAKILTRRQLYGKNEQNFKELREAIRKASDSCRSEIFYQASVVRSENWMEENKKQKMERSIPIFEALEDCDDKNFYHRNLAELGYALKDSRTPNYIRAEKVLTEAIRRRNNIINENKEEWKNYHYYYEFNRAICKLHNNPDDVDSIKRDLDLSQEKGIINRVRQSGLDESNTYIQLIERWLQTHNITFN